MDLRNTTIGKLSLDFDRNKQVLCDIPPDLSIHLFKPVPVSFLRKSFSIVNQSKNRIFGFLDGSLVAKIEPEHWTETLYLPVSRGKVWPKNSIVIYCGETVEKWDDTSVKTGIGASELAVIFLSEIWEKKGYDVTVYCNCTSLADPRFRHFSEFDSADSFDILIVWRLVEVFYHTKIDARKCLLDIHDIVDPRQITEQVKIKVDFFCMKSKYHSGLLKCIPKQIFICPNGGGLVGFLQNLVQPIGFPRKDPNYIIYTSSYDRGLAFMLKWGWKMLKKLVPNAYLKIYYGWNGFDALRPDNEDTRLYKKTIQDLMKQDGIFECGRISHDELMLEKQKASIHWYTGDFQEIDCVAVRESASVGCIPVVSDFVEVFREKPYCVRVAGNPRTKECQESAGKTVAELLLSHNKRILTLVDLETARTETWEETAERWRTMFE